MAGMARSAASGGYIQQKNPANAKRHAADFSVMLQED
jgi:hypothetical protein